MLKFSNIPDTRDISMSERPFEANSQRCLVSAIFADQQKLSLIFFDRNSPQIRDARLQAKLHVHDP